MAGLIAHVDIDAFFASVEQVRNPRLAGKPVIVGNGVIASCSYEARRFGCRAAMSLRKARRLCPQAVVLDGDYNVYHAFAERVWEVLSEFSPSLETLLDDAYLDLAGTERVNGSPLEMGRRLKARVREATGGLTASAGVAASKFVAKVASDLEKPDGLVVVPPGREAEFLAPLPVERIWGVGPKTAEALHARGLRRISDIQAMPPGILRATLGEDAAAHLEALARGIDPRPVEEGGSARQVSSEVTFGEFIPAADLDRLDRVLLSLSEDVAARLRGIGARCRRTTLKVRDDRFVTCTRSRTFDPPTCLAEELAACARGLYRERVTIAGRVRLLGVAAGELIWGDGVQLDIFDGESRIRAGRLASAVDRIRGKLGGESIVRGALMEKEER